MTKEEIIEGLKLLEDNMVYFDELLNDKGERIDVHKLLFETLEVLKQEPVLDKIRSEILEDCGYSKDYVGAFTYSTIKVANVLQIIDKYKAESEDKE